MARLEALRRRRHESATFHFGDREIALYNLSVGERSAGTTDRAWSPKIHARCLL